MSADLFAEFSNPPPKQQASTNNASGGNQLPSPSGAFSFGVIKQNPPARTASPVEKWPSFQTTSSHNGWPSNSTAFLQPAPIPLQANEEDDGWGDFETAESTVPPQLNTLSSHATSHPLPSREPEPKARLVRAPTLDIMTNTLVNIRGTPSPEKIETFPNIHWNSSTTKASQNPPNSRDPNVLFDADDFELQEGDGLDDDDDEFGDFETVAPKKPPTPPPKDRNYTPSSNSTALLDLLSLDESPPQLPTQLLHQPTISKPQPQHQTTSQPPSRLLEALSFGTPSSSLPNPPKSPSYQERNPFPDLEIKTSAPLASVKKQNQPASKSPVTAWPAAGNSPTWKDDEDDWGGWEDDAPSKGSNLKQAKKAPSPTSNWDWDAEGLSESKLASSNDSDPPPINVPPPSVILSAFPELLNSGDMLFKPIAGQNASIKQRVLANPKALGFLQGYVSLATTAARVIAGRKHRWHRDKILAKSMSISAAGSKGMKLAGVDKTQSKREDREAADVVLIWREHIGPLRSAVAAANSTGMVNLKVPELSEDLHVSTAKLVPTSPKACIICGLKREERVDKFDYDVEDSFGEWWVEHWGHRSCKNFWIKHEEKLRQR